MKIKHALIFFSLLNCFALYCQPAKWTLIEDAEEHFKHRNYLMAINVYKTELKKDPDNIKIKYRLGVCYLNTRINREEAIAYLEEASKSAKIEEEVWLYLGEAYHLNYRFEEALEAYEKFKNLKPKLLDVANRHIEQCKNAIKLVQTPSRVTFQNLGSKINSSEPDYNPFIDQDEMFLAFTSRRKENVGGKKIEVDGYRSSDIYLSNIENGHWNSARNAGRGVNSNLDEQVVGLKSHGLEMFMYLDHIDKFGDLYVTTRKDTMNDFSKPRKYDEMINEKIETSGCVNEDGDLMIFARREDLNDFSDLYMSRKLPGGNWGIPVRLPDEVNSPYNEEFPYLSYDGHTLYFSSDGHNSMGGYDLFKTTWDQKSNTFTQPVNLGYPINSTDDDKSICVTRDNRLAYVSAFRQNGFGDLDIYRVKFEDKEPVSVIYTGKVFLGDSVASHQPKHYAVNIAVTNTATNYEYTFVPHSKTGRFVMALPAGNYRISTQAMGYQVHKEEMNVSDMGKINLERTKNLLLKKNK
jgi:tetratricopeptide (TPR) repeat protein